MKKLLHWFAHKFGWYKGTVESWQMGVMDDELWTGLKCSTCGKIDSAHLYGYLFKDKENA